MKRKMNFEGLMENGKWKTHANRDRSQTLQSGKVNPGVTDLSI